MQPSFRSSSSPVSLTFIMTLSSFLLGIRYGGDLSDPVYFRIFVALMVISLGTLIFAAAHFASPLAPPSHTVRDLLSSLILAAALYGMNHVPSLAPDDVSTHSIGIGLLTALGSVLLFHLLRIVMLYLDRIDPPPCR